mgnify:FL=1
MKAIILARVSTEEQMQEGQSIPAQIERSRQWCKSKNLEIKNEYQFNESSTKDQRKKFEQIIEEIKASKDKVALVVETIDRLQRSFKESVLLDEFRKAGKLDLHFIRENLVIHKDSNSSEIQRWDLGVFVAKSYVLQISDNVKRSIDQKLRNGEFPGKAPLGYINTIDDKGNKTIIPDSERAHFIKQVFDLYIQGISMRPLAKKMRTLGLRSNPANKILLVSGIERILKDPFYYGQMRFRDKLWPHKYEPLITYETFKKAENVRTSWKKKPYKYDSKPFTLKGLATCAICGCTMTADIKKGKYVYYSCTNAKMMHKRVWIPEEKLMEPVYEVLKKLQMPKERIKIITNDLKKLHESKSLYHQENLGRLQTEYNKAQQRKENLLNLMIDSSITKDIYDIKFKELNEKQQDLAIQLEEYTKADEAFYITASRVFSLADRAYEIFKSSETEEKRQLLNFLLQNCKLNGKKLEFSLRNPFDVIVSSAGSPLVGA